MKTFYSIPKENIEAEALKQVKNIEELDCLKSFAIMPDVHAGYDMPIGGVALLDGQISPSFVGYDIGCGVSHINTTYTGMRYKDISDRKNDIFEEIYNTIPVGFKSLPQPVDYITEFVSASGDKQLTERINDKIRMQYGTLGGGNHFIEIGVNDIDVVGITIHSGSRNVGHTVAEFYMKKGRMFDIESELGQAYLSDMNFCLEFALENREKMMQSVLSILGVKTSCFIHDTVNINKNHNHAVVTESGILHRKGAISAGKGEMGIILDNMNDGTYIVIGLGNGDYLNSASHGAERTMSRTKAKETINIDDFQNIMKGIKAKVDKETLDKSPFAYKNLDDVIAAQNGRNIRVIDRFMPIINIKG